MASSQTDIWRRKGKREWNKTPGSLESKVQTWGRHRERDKEMKDGGEAALEGSNR